MTVTASRIARRLLGRAGLLAQPRQVAEAEVAVG